MQHIGSSLKRALDTSKDTERGDLMQYFRRRLNEERASDGFPTIAMARMGKVLEKIPTKDLYYLKRVCDDAKNFSKKFWWELNPKNFENGVARDTGAIAADKRQKKNPSRRKGGGVRPQDYVW